MNRNCVWRIVLVLVLAGLSERSCSEDAPRKDDSNQIQLVTKNDANITAVSDNTKKHPENPVTVTANKTVTLPPDNVTAAAVVPNVTVVRVDGEVYKVGNNTIPRWWTNIKSGALQRTGLVVLGIITLFLFFFLVHTVRVRNRRSKSRKYGVIASTSSELELEPLERTTLDDDEEETLFDAQHNFRIK